MWINLKIIQFVINQQHLFFLRLNTREMPKATKPDRQIFFPIPRFSFFVFSNLCRAGIGKYKRRKRKIKNIRIISSYQYDNEFYIKSGHIGV